MGIDQSEPTIIKFILGLGLVWAIALTKFYINGENHVVRASCPP
ncbi:hypothetical protein [Okeania sp. SIO1I7]|nr:hypothetical protein [Okeania sp. SIO1I7]